LTTIAHSTTTAPRQNIPNQTLAPDPRPTVAVFSGSIGAGVLIAAPAKPPLTPGFRNRNSSIATANAKVTIAKLTPRTRNAGNATRMPTTIAPRAPTSGLMGNGNFGMIVCLCR